MWKCSKCGGGNVESLGWYNANTGEITSEIGEEGETFCNDCDQLVELIYEDGEELP